MAFSKPMLDQVQSAVMQVLPSEMRIALYDQILSDYKGDKNIVSNPRLTCQRLKREVENEMPHMFETNLIAAVRSIQEAWIQTFPPFIVGYPSRGDCQQERPVLLLDLPREMFLHPTQIDHALTLLSPLFSYHLLALQIKVHDHTRITQ
jgi:hypothetical protein